MAPDESSTRRKRLFGQRDSWIDARGRLVAIGDMSRAHLEAVVAMLRRDADEWHRDEREVTSAVLDQLTNDGQAEDSAGGLWADSFATADATAWLEQTVLMRAILDRLDEMRAEDPAGRHDCLCERPGVAMRIVELYESEDPDLTHIVWVCPACGVRVRQERPREGVDVERLIDMAEARSWPS